MYTWLTLYGALYEKNAVTNYQAFKIWNIHVQLFWQIRRKKTFTVSSPILWSIAATNRAWPFTDTMCFTLLNIVLSTIATPPWQFRQQDCPAYNLLIWRTEGWTDERTRCRYATAFHACGNFYWNPSAGKQISCHAEYVLTNGRTDNPKKQCSRLLLLVKA